MQQWCPCERRLVQGPGQVPQVSLTHLLWFLQWLQQVQKDQEAAELQGCSFLRCQLRVLQRWWHTGSCWEAGHDGTAQTQIQELPPAFVLGILTEKRHYRIHFPKTESLFIKFLFHLLLLNLLGLVYLSVQKLTLNKYFLTCWFIWTFGLVSGSRNSALLVALLPALLLCCPLRDMIGTTDAEAVCPQSCASSVLAGQPGCSSGKGRGEGKR